MTKLIYEIINKRDKILEIAKKYGVENIRIFGSVASGKETEKSDIDLLVDIAKKPDGTKGDYFDFAFEVEGLFDNRIIECCTPEDLHPRFTEKVLNNNISIMEDNPVLLPKSKRDYIVNVEKTLKWIEEYKKFIQEYNKEDIIKDYFTRGSFRSAIQQPLEEMVRFVPLTLRKQFAPDTNWEKIKKLRNVIVHQYDNLPWGSVWNRAKEQLEDLEDGCKKILKHLKEKEAKNKK